MALIVARSIKKKEWKYGKYTERDLSVVIDAFFEGIGSTIKGEQLPKGSQLWKVYATTVKGARRIVYLVDVATGDGFFLCCRDKKDVVGENITIKNPAFQKLLQRYLQFLDEDMDAGNFDVYSRQ